MTPDSRRGSAARTLLLALAVAGCGPVGDGAPLPRGPGLARGSAAGFNVVLITLDTTRADRLGCYGNAAARTPALDSLAARGIRFHEAVTVVPTTLASHASILTGLYPPHHGVRDNGGFRLAPEQTTLAEILVTQGYRTAAFLSAFVLDHRFGLGQGFEHYDDAVEPREQSAVSDLIDERSAQGVTDAAVHWLTGSTAGDRPFFAWVHYFDPHRPWEPPEPFHSDFADRPYDGEIAYVDSQIGRLIETVEARGAGPRTLYVVVADHGEGLGDHGEQTHGMFLYDSVLRVPLILAAPGLLDAPVAGAGVAVTIDILPTVLDLVGLAHDGPIDGRSLLDADRPDRAVYLETLYPYLAHGWSALHALRRHEDKYVRAPRPEYFDLLEDPLEIDDRFDDPPAGQLSARDDLVVELERLLAEWPTLEGGGVSALALDSETLERLESLGYVGGGSAVTDASHADPKDMLPTLLQFEAASALARAGRLDQALTELEGVVRSSPSDRAALAQIARIQLQLGRPREAEQALRRYLALRPHAKALVQLAQILVAGRRLDEVGALLDEAERIEPEYGATFVVKGDVAAAAGKFDLARGLYLHAAEIDSRGSGQAVRTRLALLERLAERKRR